MSRINLPSWYNPTKSTIFRSPQCVEYYRSIFDEWDKDKDGYISMEELKTLVASHENITLSMDHINLLTASFDKNGDDRLDFEEFLEMINHPKFKTIFTAIASKYLRFVDIPRHRRTLKLRRNTSNTGEYEKEYSFSWFRVFMISISLLQVILHYTNYSSIKDLSQKEIEEKHIMGYIVRALRYTPRKKTQVYRYITYALVHDPFEHTHLWFNVIAQICIGIPLEMIHGWRIIVLYWLGALGGCLTHAAMSPSDGVQGASGAVYSFYTAHVATVILNWKEMTHPVITLIVFFILTTMPMVIILIQTLCGVQKSFNKISHACHLGGAIVGLLLGVAILRNIRVTKKEKIVSKVGAIGFILFMSCMISVNIYYGISREIIKGKHQPRLNNTTIQPRLNNTTIF